MVINTPEQIELYRLYVLKSALKLEITGMKRKGKSAYSIIKQELGLTGSKSKVLDKLKAQIIKQEGKR